MAVSDTGAVSGPLRVQLTRGDLVESEHEVHAVVARAGTKHRVFGDADRSVLPRSSVKMVQAMPLLSTGAADAFGLDSVQLALACASHSAEPLHLEAIRAWLDRIGLDESSLECGTPVGRDSPVAHECSGKHVGFLTVARHLEVDPAGYSGPDHPVQQLVTAALADTFGLSATASRVGIDGCGIPVYPVRLASLAEGIGRFAGATSATRLVGAMRAQPFLVAGTQRLCTELMEDTTDVIAKLGAEGVYLAATVDGGWSAAVKVVDGAIRAAELALLHLVEASGRSLSDRLLDRRVIRSAAGVVAGEARVVEP